MHRACSSYECFIQKTRRISSKSLKQGYLVECFKSSFRKFSVLYGDLIQAMWSLLLTDITWHSNFWSVTVTPNRSEFPSILLLVTVIDLHRFTSSFHGCQQGTLTILDTWFRPPFWDWVMLKLLRLVFPNFPCLFSTCRLKKSSVLSRFWLRITD